MDAKQQIDEILLWKLGGAAAWHAGLFAIGALAWHVVAWPTGSSPPGAPGASSSLLTCFHLLVLYMTTLLVLYYQRRVLSAIDVPPLKVPQLGLTHSSWVALFISRCVVRTYKLADVVDAALFYAACMLSGCYCARSFARPPQAPPLGWAGGCMAKWTRSQCSDWAAGSSSTHPQAPILPQLFRGAALPCCCWC